MKGELDRLVRPLATGRSASFRLRFRFVRAMRAGEAKLRARVRRASLTLGLGVASIAHLRAVWRAIFAAIRMGFNDFRCFLFAFCVIFVDRHMGFKKIENAAYSICMGFKR